MDIPSFTHFQKIISSKEFLGRCFLLTPVREMKDRHKALESRLNPQPHIRPNKNGDVLLVHDVAEEQDRLDDDEDYKMNCR